MRKLSVEEEVKRDLIHAKYQYPATCTTYDKKGNMTSYRVVTHNVEKTKELQALYPSLMTEINKITEDKSDTYKPFRLCNLGKN